VNAITMPPLTTRRQRAGDVLTVEFIVPASLSRPQRRSGVSINESLLVSDCHRDQDETDRYWNAISAMAARRVRAAGARTGGVLLADHAAPRLMEALAAAADEAKRAFEP